MLSPHGIPTALSKQYLKPFLAFSEFLLLHKDLPALSFRREVGIDQAARGLQGSAQVHSCPQGQPSEKQLSPLFLSQRGLLSN